MRLSNLIQATQIDRVIGFRDDDILKVAYTPEAVAGGGVLFACIDEYHHCNKWGTGRTYLEVLPQLPLAALLTSEPVTGLTLPQLVTKNPRQTMGEIARLLAGCPDREMRVVGVTGTNGKTTTTRLLGHLWRNSGNPCATLGTLGLEMGELGLSAGSYTTPLAPELYQLMDTARKANVSNFAMEVSSHALALERVAGLRFDAAILTNLERDHLDFHGTPEAYAAAKLKLFNRLHSEGLAVLNRGASRFETFAACCRDQMVTYGRKGSGANLEAENFRGTSHGSAFDVLWRGQRYAFNSRLAGTFQLENSLAALALLLSWDMEVEALAEGLASFQPVCGRMQSFTLPNGAVAIVDYAHNPDGLRNVLQTCRSLCKGALHVVFGCGGDRDRGKRPLMGALAAELADVCWLTSDNPRTEDPEDILEDIASGMPAACRLERISDREAAIRAAVAAAGESDLVLVAGKGHEDYQIIGLEKHPFSDQDILRRLGAKDASGTPNGR